MKRMSLFEFEDFSWCPVFFRKYLTNYLRSMHRVLKTHEVIAPLLERALRETKEQSIIDLCSGSGGPIVDAVRLASQNLEGPVRVTMTDLYPNPEAIQRTKEENDPTVVYLESRIDAANVPADLEGIRTMICSFHHMPPTVAKAILTDCFQKRKGLCIFEISDNSAPNFLWWIPLPIGFILTLLMTPFVRPLSLGQLFFTYIIPIMPIMIAWDGAASNARTYTKEDLLQLIREANLEDESYRWEIEPVTKKGVPGKMLYLLGLPSLRD